MKLPHHLFPSLIVMLSGWVLPWQSSTAQILPDSTLPGNSLVTPNGQIWEITGGTQAGGNLFHSFEKFSVLTGETAFFNHSLDIQNIFSRVTGASVSEIDGLIRANGTANLFLLNPNGIMFGPNARLDIGGSFFASTADRINFADGSFFSATNPEASPVLMINVPIGLQLGQNPGTISNQSKVSSNEQTIGLQVQPGETLGLLGGEVMFDGGALTTEGGFIQVGSVAGNSQVSLSPIDQGWKFGYDEVDSFQNIVLNNGAFISTSTFGNGDAGNLTVHADSIEIVGNGNMGDILNKILSNQFTPDDLRDGLFTVSFGEGAAGNLEINTNNLHLSNGAVISASSFGDGLGGNLEINASEMVNVNNSGLLTGTRASNELAKAGDLTVNTGRLIVEAGGIIATSTLSSGQGGELEITASESVELIGQSEDPFQLPIYKESRNIPSGLLTLALGDGDAGNLTIHTQRFSIRDSAVATTSTLGEGRGGNLEIIAADSVELLATDSIGDKLTQITEGFDPDDIRDGIFTASLGSGNSGNLQIHTNELSLQNGAVISTTTANSGQGGDLTVNATESIQIIDAGLITGTGGIGTAGDLEINTNGRLLIQSGGVAGTSSIGRGQGGNLNVTADLVELTGISSGKFTLLKPIFDQPAEISSGLFTLNFNNTENSLEGQAGNLTVKARELRINNGAAISTTTVNGEQSGDLTIHASDLLEIRGNGNLPILFGKIINNNISPSDLRNGIVTASFESGEAGSLEINTSHLMLENGGIISASTFTDEDGGDLTINASGSVKLVGSVILTGTSNRGNSGNLAINTGSLNLQDGALILTSTLTEGQGGNLTVNADLVELTGTTEEQFILPPILSELLQIPSGLVTLTIRGNGNAGDLKVDTNNLVIQNGAQIATSTFSAGNAGDLTLNVADSLQIAGSSSLGDWNSSVRSDAFPMSSGNAGNVTVETNKLIVQNGGFLSAATAGSGNGGNLTVIAAELIELTGNGNFRETLIKFIKSDFKPEDIRDGLFTTSFGSGTAGNLHIETGRLNIRNGALGSASTFVNGQGGNLDISATESITLFESGLLTGTASSKPAGDLTISTRQLNVFDGSVIATSTLGSGDGGNLTINASEFVKVISSAPFVNLISLPEVPVFLFAPGQISVLLTATFQSGNAGDLEINTERLIVENGSQISSENIRNGQAGNLMINAADSLEIIGQTEGMDEMRTSRILPLPSILRTSTSGSQTAGDITINTGSLILTNGGQLEAVSRASGFAGNVEVMADSIRLENGTINVDTQGGGGNIQLNSGDLILRDNSNITTNARESGTGGDITINTRVIVGLENSDITTNAQGQAGKITINFRGLFGLQERTGEELPSRLGGELTVNSPNELPSSDITAFSLQSPELNGNIVFNTPQIDPTSGLLRLPQTPVDVTSLVDRRCTPSNPQQSSFINIGRGGKPATPRDPLSSNGGWVDPNFSEVSTTASVPTDSYIYSDGNNDGDNDPVPPFSRGVRGDRIVEAQGWIFNEQGQIILVGESDTVTPDRFLPTPRCQ